MTPTLTDPPARATAPFLDFHRRARALCVDRLRDALGPETALFDRQLRERRWGGTRGTEDVTSTAIVLIGAHRAGVEPDRIGLSPDRTVESLVEQARRRAYLGGHGLVLWACAVWDRLSVRRLSAVVGAPLLDPAAYLPRITTMEVAWLASGLAHEAARSARARDGLAAAVRELIARFDGRTRLFRHATAAAPFAHRLRRAVANFADQIYAVQALAFAAIVLGDEPARRTSDAGADRLAELQGPLGQWPWHYDAGRGVVSRFFPVYSVHQHGMAPMALLAVAAAGGAARPRAVERSAAWLSDNELGTAMLDDGSGTIWRDIRAREGVVARLAREAREVLGRGTAETARTSDLYVNHETRPYEWAWCLYAGAIAAGGSMRGHVV